LEEDAEIRLTFGIPFPTPLAFTVPAFVFIVPEFTTTAGIIPPFFGVVGIGVDGGITAIVILAFSSGAGKVLKQIKD